MNKKTFISFIFIAVLIAGFLGYQSVNAITSTYTQPLYDSHDIVATADAVTNAYSRDVIGNKTDAAAADAVSTTESLMAYAKQNVGANIAIDTVVDSVLVDTGTTIPGTITTAQADLDILTGASGANLLTATQASIDAIEVDTSTTIPATITTAQNDLDILTGASGANLLTATQASIDAIEVDTETTIPGTIATAQADLDIITGATGVNLLTATQTSIDAIETDTSTTLPATLAIAAAAAAPSYSHTNYLAVATGTFDTSGGWSTVASHEIATVTGMVRMTIIAECVTSVSSVSDTGTMTLGDETTGASIIAASTIGSGLMAAGELWVDATLTRTILTRTQLNGIEFVVAAGKDIGYTVGTNALNGGSMIFHIYWTPLDATGAVVAGEGGTL